MKLFSPIKIFIFLVVIILYSSNINSIRVSNSNLKRTGTRVHLTRLHSLNTMSAHMFLNSVKNVEGIKGQKNQDYILLSAYYRLKAFTEALPGMVQNSFILKVYPKTTVTKVIFGLDMDALSDKKSVPRDTPLVKVCVPTVQGKKSFVTFHCVFGECGLSYEDDEAMPCSNMR